MKRTKFDSASRSTSDQKLALYSTLLSRSLLFNRFGQQYGGARDIYQALGYKTELTYEDYAARYERQDIAKAIINRPIQATWRGKLELNQGKKERTTQFEKAWNDLWEKFKLKSKFIRLDKLSNIGRYGILLFGFDDVKNTDQWRTPVNKKANLIYLNPLHEGNAKIAAFDQNSTSPRFGQPELYNVTLSSEDEANRVSKTMVVHHTRVIHVAGELLESDIYGVPALKAVFNRLMDLEKLVGASAEMFWRGARPGYSGKVDKDHFISDPARDDLMNQLDEYEHDLRRFLINEGIDIAPLESQVSDPDKHVEVQIQMISAVTGIPKRILIGSERGELASSEDKASWLELIQTRQSEYAENQILRPFIDKCVLYSILPDPKIPYTFIWPDLFAPSIKERAKIGKTRAGALQSYMNNPAAAVVFPPAMFYEFMLGLTPEEIKYLQDNHKTNVKDDLTEIFKQIQASQAAGIGQGRSASGVDKAQKEE